MRQFIFIIGVLIASIFSAARVNAQTCTTPAQVPNVQVAYPSCDSNDFCDFTKATCSWGSVSNAVSYSVKSTEVETGTIVYNQSVAATLSTVTFSITQGKTYKCDVSAVNSCGTAGPAGTHSLLCQIDAVVTTTPTIAPTQSIIPTSTIMLSPTITLRSPPPIIPTSGNITGTIFAGAGLMLILIVGTIVFII